MPGNVKNGTGESWGQQVKVSIYRVEQANGAGPYSWDYKDTLSEMFDEHNDASPKQDSLLEYIDPGEHCGFATLGQLKEWFEGYEDALASLGFRGARYSVPLALVRYGRTQAVFVRGDLFPEEIFSLN